MWPFKKKVRYWHRDHTNKRLCYVDQDGQIIGEITPSTTSHTFNARGYGYTGEFVTEQEARNGVELWCE